MRITQNMISNTVVQNMQKSISRFMTLQTNMSSGRRINKPSDDPIGTVKDLSYRAELEAITQYQENISSVSNRMKTYDTIMNDLNTLVNDIRLDAERGATEIDNGVRDSLADTVEAAFNSILNLSNDKLEGSFIFSGHKTNSKALKASAHGVTYTGDYGLNNIPIQSESTILGNILGSDLFLKKLSVLGGDVDEGAKGDLDPALLATTPVTDLNNGQGIDQAIGTFTITDNVLGITSTVDISDPVAFDEMGDILAEINNQLAADGITDLTAVISEDKSGIKLEVNSSGIITGNTPIKQLNGGNGIDLSPGKFNISDGGAINIEIDVSGCSNITDIINTFNAEMALQGYPDVTMQIDPVGKKGLEIIDATVPAPLGLTITDPAGENTANGLGLIGAVGASVIGGDLNPQPSFDIEETTGTTAADLGIKKSIYKTHYGEDLDPILLATTLISDLNHGMGYGMGALAISQGDERVTIDLSNGTIVTMQDLLDAFNGASLEITASINSSGRGIQIVNDNPNKSLMVTDIEEGTIAKELGLFGSGDMMGSILALIDALRRNDQEGTGLLLGNLDDSLAHIRNSRATVGSRVIRLESTENRLLKAELSFTELLSEVEDADMTKLITDLATYENNYQASLMAGAKIIQPSLLDFLG